MEKSNKFVRFMRAIGKPILCLLFRIEIKGLENLPTDRGYIFCSNHIHFLDAVFWLFFIKYKIIFLGKQELFKYKLFGAIFKKAGIIAVKRGTADKSAISQATSVTNDNVILGIFPEGTRSRTGELLRAKSGVAYIANESKADVVPAAIVVNGKVRIFKKIKLVIGKPILHQELKFEEELSKKDNLRKVTTRIMSEIKELIESSR